jgi:predicted  nucleic acid-binding Zn-ribbon protein
MTEEKKIPASMEDMERYFKVFSDELNILTTELQSLDNLYDEMKQAIDDATQRSKNNRRNQNSPFVFLFNMYSNLNANRSNKLMLIRDLAKLKKTVVDLTFRENRGDELESKFKALAGSLYKQIKDAEDRNPIEGKEVLTIPLDLDDIAKDAYKEETGEDYSEQEEETLYVCDEEEGRIFSVNDMKELEIIDEVEEDDIPDMFKVDYKPDGRVRRCLNLLTGSNIPVIHFDEE